MLKNNLDKILSEIEKISEGIISPQAPIIDKEGKWPEQSMQALMEKGIGSLVIPESMGGLGQGMYGLVKACERIAQSCGSTGMCFGMHCVGSAVISSKATEYQKNKFIEPIIDGKAVTSLALSEPGTGAHFYFPQTRITDSPNNEYVLNGEKSFITNGNHSDFYVVSTMAIQGETPFNEFSCIVVERDTSGLEWGKPWKGLGMRGNSSINLKLKNVKVDKRNLLGEKGDQLWYVFNVVAPYFLMAMSGSYLGIAQAAYNEALEHLKTRSYSYNGRSISSVQTVQHRLGMLWANLERTRQLIYNAALEGDKGNDSAVPLILAAKAEVANCAVEMVNEAMTLTGGVSYRENSKLEMLLRDARAAHIMSPTTDLLYTWIGRLHLEYPILGD